MKNLKISETRTNNYQTIAAVIYINIFRNKKYVTGLFE
jgi:hypothetical protein